MYPGLLFKGLLTGLMMSLPMGPLAILVVQRTANRDMKSGFYTGMGIAFTDSVWALIAGFSVTYLIAFLNDYKLLIQSLAALVLFVLGYYIFRTKPLRKSGQNNKNHSRPFKCFYSSVLVALSNPAAIFVYIIIFAGANIVFDIRQPGNPIVFIIGFLVGALGWWFALTYLVDRLRIHFNFKRLCWFNRISGSVIMLLVVVGIVVVIVKGSAFL